MTTLYEPALPQWQDAPEAPDETGTSFLVAGFSGAGADPELESCLATWASAARAIGPTTSLRAERFDAGEWSAALTACHTGVRVMVVGGQHDVLLALAAARQHGLLPCELRSWVIATDDLALYCAHCRATSRVQAAPGDLVRCPGCHRELEIHTHASAVLGSFLGSDAHAREIA